MRTTITIPDEQARRPAAACRTDGIPRVEAVRRAIERYLDERKSHRDREEFFGIWRDRRVDGLACQRRLRREWSRVRILLDTGVRGD